MAEKKEQNRKEKKKEQQTGNTPFFPTLNIPTCTCSVAHYI
jgi:hypothetical protein